MTKRTSPREPQSAVVTPDQMKAAIPKLKRRIKELQDIDVSTIQERSESKLIALEQKIDSTLVDIFGNGTVEHRRYRVMLDTAAINLTYETPLHKIQIGYEKGINRAKSNLQTIIDLFEEHIEDMGESPEGRALRAFGELDIHPEVARAVTKLFNDGHYANAVENACKVLDGLVKIRSGVNDKSGTDLMQHVFSVNNPILKFKELNTETERSEQKGMMFLYAGAMLAMRNPRAHELIEDDPEKALEYIAFISLLAKSLDKANRS